MECRHFPDRSRKNNRLNNLQWGTPLENAADKDIHGTRVYGSKVGSSKIKERDIDRIFAMRANGKLQKEIGKAVGLTCTTVGSILRGRIWKHKTADKALEYETYNRGEIHASSKLKEDDIQEIFELRSAGLSQQKIADRFNVKQISISCILRRKTWKHIVIKDSLLSKTQQNLMV